jgi:hypothetical protein
MNEIERDRRLDAAWSAASREEPPPSLDAAIRAAARRAVDAAPRPKRDKHWWYPLATAATVAVLAVGILQLTPPEQVAPTIVADMTVAPREANKDLARPVEPADTKAVEPSAAITAPSPAATPSPPAQAPARRAQGVAVGSVAGERAPAPASESDTLKQSLTAKREFAAQDKLASAKPDIAAANTVPPPSAAAPPVAPPRSEPFPAAAAPEPRRDAYADERKAAANAPAGATAPQVARSAAAPSAEEAQTRDRLAMAKVAPADDAKAKEGAARSVEEWIKRIRDLKNAGRQDEAAKELAAFRAAYGERTDALLPADLRAMKASAPK